MAKRSRATEPLTAVMLPNEPTDSTNTATATETAEPEQQQEQMAIVGKPMRILNSAKPANGNGNGHTNILPQNLCVKLINDLSTRAVEFELFLRKVAPKFEEIGAIAGMNFDDVRSLARANHGNGEYTVQDMQNGVNVPGDNANMRFKVTNAPEKSASDEIEDPAKRAKAKTQELQERRKQIEAEAELAKAQSDIERNKRKDEEDAERRKAAPLETLLSEMKSLKEQASAPKPSLLDQIKELTPLLAVLVPLLKREPDHSTADAIKLMVDSQKQQTEMLMKSIEKMKPDNSDAKEWRTLAMDLILKKADSGDMFKMMREIRKETIEEIQGMMPSPESEDIRIDPNNPFWSIIAGVLNMGIKGFKSLSQNPEMAQVISQVAANIGKKPEQLTESDVPALENEIAAAQRQQQQQRRQPRLAPPSIPPPGMAFPQANVSPINPNLAPPVDVSSPEIQAAPTTASVPETTPPPTPVPVPVQTPEQLNEMKVKLEEDLQAEINQSIEEMILDVTSGRVARGQCVWIENAVELWNRDFLNYLESITGHMERLKIVKSKATPAVWEKLDACLAQEAEKANIAKPNNGTYIFNNFFNSFESLSRLWKERKPS